MDKADNCDQKIQESKATVPHLRPGRLQTFYVSIKYLDLKVHARLRSQHCLYK